jgi:hypothetical protein
MDFISKIFNMDLGALIPEMPVFLQMMRTLMALALVAGPITMMIQAAVYLFKPAPEANFTRGYRTYYGMGSTEAWTFSQKIAGLAFGGLGVLLLLAMFIVILCFRNKTLMWVAITVMICMIVQVVLLAAARITIAILCGKFFDKDGLRRRPAPRIREKTKV